MRLVELSDLFRAAKTVEELEAVRSRVRSEVKNMPKDSQQWLLDELNSAKRLFELPDIPEKLLKKLEKENGTNTHRTEHERSSKQDRRNRKRIRYGKGFKLPDARDEKSRSSQSDV